MNQSEWRIKSSSITNTVAFIAVLAINALANDPIRSSSTRSANACRFFLPAPIRAKDRTCLIL